MDLAACYQGLLSLPAAPWGAEVRLEWPRASAITQPYSFKHSLSEEGPYVSWYYSIKSHSFYEMELFEEDQLLFCPLLLEDTC